jgi:hypothetical protein
MNRTIKINPKEWILAKDGYFPPIYSKNKKSSGSFSSSNERSFSNDAISILHLWVKENAPFRFPFLE